MGSVCWPRPVSCWKPVFCLSFLFLLAAGVAEPSAYEEALRQFDFPVGILPKGVTGYDLNPATGEFSAHMNGTCGFKLENNYELSYQSTIKGVIYRGKLEKLNGVTVKVLLLWLNIVEVRRTGGELEFSVGIASAKFPVTRDDDELDFSVGIASADFPVDNFDESPQCGCGFDCDSSVSTGEKMEASASIASSPGIRFHRLRRFCLCRRLFKTRSDPLFKVLLENVEEEFGFDHSGGLTIPCEIETFKYLLEGEIEVGEILTGDVAMGIVGELDQLDGRRYRVVHVGKLEELHGVAVKVLFFWVNVEKVQRNGNDLEFTTRIKSATFPVSDFGASPQCGCGFQCGNADNIGQGMTAKLKMRGLKEYSSVTFDLDYTKGFHGPDYCWCILKNGFRQMIHDSQPMTGIIIFTLSLLYLSPFIASIAVADGGDSFSAYEILQSYDFPVGILPKGAKGYDLDDTTGKFRAYFNGACSFSLEGSYQLRYKSTISGSISKDRLTNLSGVSVKVLFLWLNIVEVVRNGDVLEFSVGIALAKFTIDNFDVSPQCGCGFNCNNIGQVTKLRRSAFVSSL
ncbi:hypothetical protein RJ639_047316 [Escallonia herrerae]|uniref:Uncharacterized protein n=1 Tax=Escallonia herrerae TaxID=1293975 RepID=A0AA88W6Y2_9ASTE|nr:hypothetical protein RJ639_047316 [Escallonia herrerae]